MPVLPEGKLLARVVLIGEAGDPARENRAVLVELERWTGAHPDRTVTLFLDDNVYAKGFESADDARAQAILQAQLAAARGHACVIPGNHDWGHTDGMRQERILARQAFVDAADDATYLPRDGCLGPETTALLPDAALPRPLVLVAVGTTWLLEPMRRPSCSNVHYEVMPALEAQLNRCGSTCISDPVRAQGTLGKPVYSLVREDLGRAVAQSRPIVYAAGHAHSLQLYEDD